MVSNTQTRERLITAAEVSSLRAKHAGVVADVSIETRGADPRSAEYPYDNDGVWFELKPGWQYEACHSVHVWTRDDAARRLAAVEPCDCDDCKDDLSSA